MRKLNIFLILATLGGTVSGCSGDGEAPPTPPQMVFFDLETNQPLLQDASTDVPAINRKTGKRTLMPALYCPECRAWRPAPPVEVAQRTPAALKCSQCQSKLITEGPPPE